MPAKIINFPYRRHSAEPVEQCGERASELCLDSLAISSLLFLYHLFEHFKVQENRKREILAN